MKKLLLLSALALGALTANSQNVTVTVEGNEIENGAVVNSYHLDPILVEFGTYKLLPEVVATFTTDCDVMVNVYNKTTGLPQNIQFCWPSGCAAIGPGSVGTQTKTVDAGDPQDLAIDVTLAPYIGFDFNKDETYTFATTVEIIYGAADPFVFDLNMIYDPNHQEDAVENIFDNDIDAAPVYFDLGGRKINNPEKGIYIMQKGSKVSKVVL